LAASDRTKAVDDVGRDVNRNPRAAISEDVGARVIGGGVEEREAPGQTAHPVRAVGGVGAGLGLLALPTGGVEVLGGEGGGRGRVGAGAGGGRAGRAGKADGPRNGRGRGGDEPPARARDLAPRAATAPRGRADRSPSRTAARAQRPRVDWPQRAEPP